MIRSRLEWLFSMALLHGGAANNLSAMYTVGRGVTRSKRQAMRRGGVENTQSTDIESTKRVRASV